MKTARKPQAATENGGAWQLLCMARAPLQNSKVIEVNSVE